MPLRLSSASRMLVEIDRSRRRDARRHGFDLHAVPMNASCRLGRDVAVAGLHTADLERLTRFERDARALAARSRGTSPTRSTPRTTRASSIATSSLAPRPARVVDAAQSWDDDTRRMVKSCLPEDISSVVCP